MALQKKKKEKKFSIQDFFSICDKIRSLLLKSFIENFIFCAVWFSQARTVILIIAGLSDAYLDVSLSSEYALVYDSYICFCF